MLETFFEQLGITAVVVAILGFLGRNYIEHLSFKYQKQFSTLHDKRAKIAAKLYAKINNLWRAMSDYIGVKPADQERQREIEKNVIDAAEDFKKFYQDHEIWFPGKICDKFYELNEEMLKAFIEQAKAERPEKFGQSTDRFIKAQKAFTHCDKIVRPEIRASFRKLLGVEE